MGRGIIHGQVDHRTDAPKLTAGKLAAVVAHESLWDAIREDSRLEDFHHLSDRLSRIQPTGDDRAGMIVQDGNQIPIKAIALAGIEITHLLCFAISDVTVILLGPTPLLWVKGQTSYAASHRRSGTHRDCPRRYLSRS